MIVTYQFNCSQPGCKAYVATTLHMHDDHAYSLEKLGEALGFRRAGGPNAFNSDRWQCVSHQTEAP